MGRIRKEIKKTKNGKFIRKVEYLNNKQHGEYICNWEGTDLVCEQSNWKEGKIDGQYKIFNKDGSLRDHHLYKNGILIKDFLKNKGKK